MNTTPRETEKKYLIIYHTQCLDGITAAAVTHKYLTEVCSVDDVDIHHWPASYNDEITPIHDKILEAKITHVYIVDFSFPLETIELIDSCVDAVTVYDHHASAFRKLCGEPYDVQKDSMEAFNIFRNTLVVLDNNESGASLCWKELMQPATGDDNQLPHLVSYVKDYDLYRFALDDTSAVNKYLKQKDKTVEGFVFLLTWFEECWARAEACKIGHTILSYEESLEEELISGGTTPITINGVSGLAVNAPPTLSSSIGNKLAAKSGTFGATWCQMSEGVVKFSLRSIGDSCDVSRLAEIMGGGGHKNAAGFEMKSPEYDDNVGITLWGGE